MSKITITGNGATGEVLLDGQKIGHCIVGCQVEMKAGHFPQVRLEMAPMDALLNLDECDLDFTPLVFTKPGVMPEVLERQLLAHLLKKYSADVLNTGALYSPDRAQMLGLRVVDAARGLVQLCEPVTVAVDMASGSDQTAFATGGLLSREAFRRLAGDGGIEASALGPIAVGAAALLTTPEQAEAQAASMLRLPVKETMADASPLPALSTQGFRATVEAMAVPGAETMEEVRQRLAKMLKAAEQLRHCNGWPFGGSKPVTLLPEEAEQTGPAAMPANANLLKVR